MEPIMEPSDLETPREAGVFVSYESRALERQAQISDRVVNMLGTGLVEPDVARGRAGAEPPRFALTAHPGRPDSRTPTAMSFAAVPVCIHAPDQPRSRRAS